MKDRLLTWLIAPLLRLFEPRKPKPVKPRKRCKGCENLTTQEYCFLCRLDRDTDINGPRWP